MPRRAELTDAAIEDLRDFGAGAGPAARACPICSESHGVSIRAVFLVSHFVSVVLRIQALQNRDTRRIRGFTIDDEAENRPHPGRTWLRGESPEGAGLVLAGQVLVDDQKVEKPGHLVAPEARSASSGAAVRRAAAASSFKPRSTAFRFLSRDACAPTLGPRPEVSPTASCRPAPARFYAFDVGTGQLAWKLRSDPRVVVRDRFNVRNITAHDLPLQISLVTADLSFISLDKILPPLSQALRLRTREWKDRPAPFHVDLVLLVKPQFEVGKGEVGKGGIVRSPEKRLQAVARVESIGSRPRDTRWSAIFHLPISGAKRNQEFLLYLRLFPDL